MHESDGNPQPLRFVRAGRCGNGDGCIEVARRPDDTVEVRDSADANSASLVVGAQEWETFLSGAKEGDFDHL